MKFNHDTFCQAITLFITYKFTFYVNNYCFLNDYHLYFAEYKQGRYFTKTFGGGGACTGVSTPRAVRGPPQENFWKFRAWKRYFSLILTDIRYMLWFIFLLNVTDTYFKKLATYFKVLYSRWTKTRKLTFMVSKYKIIP